ncbi:MAG: efflux transporter periplasmic adaptor subunit [Piscirickettsiaceae bacterium]|nr:MAG: efflux transporter periplasmic adaptor subunit [Piscirickettsiaceae bacterium]
MNNVMKCLVSWLLTVCVIQPAFAEHGHEKKVLYWVAPMDPNFRRDEPGKSPMGMELVPVYNSDDSGSSVTISPEMVQSLGIRTAKVERTRLWRRINTVGYVDYDEMKVSHVHLRVSGWIEHLGAHAEGERFAKGDTLLELYSPELVNAQQEYLQALSSGNKRLIRASNDRLNALGLLSEQIKTLKKTRNVQQRVPILAEHDGVVSTLSVRHGMYVTPANKVMSLADLSSVWMLVEVFEKQANWVKEGNPAEVTLSYLPGKVWKGKVEYIYPSLNPKTRALMVRLRFDNPNEELKPNMFAKVKIFSGPTESTLVIPTEALIRTGDGDHLIIKNSDGGFEPKVVVAGIESGQFIEILSGINEGDDVVVSGQFLIDSEASLRGSFKRMEPVTGRGAEK